MRDLLEHRLCRQPLLHQTRHHVLKEESVEAAHHHDGVEDYQERRHRSAEPETAVQNHERDGQDREPDMRAQPALHRPDAPERNFFPQTQQRRESDVEYAVSPHTAWLLDLPEERSPVERPPRPQAQLALGAVWLSAGENDKARAAFEEATRRHPESAEAWASLGVLGFRMRLLRDAVLRHRGDARTATDRYKALDPADQAAVVAFLGTLKAPPDAPPLRNPAVTKLARR